LQIDELVTALNGVHFSNNNNWIDQTSNAPRHRARSESFGGNLLLHCNDRTRSASDSTFRHDMKLTISISNRLTRSDSDESSALSPADVSICNTACSTNSTFSRPNSSRGMVAPSPLDPVFVSRIGNVSLVSPTYSANKSNDIISERHLNRMNRISEVCSTGANSPSTTPTQILEEEGRFNRVVFPKSQNDNIFESDAATVIDEDFGADDIAQSQLEYPSGNVIDENNNFVRIIHVAAEQANSDHQCVDNREEGKSYSSPTLDRRSSRVNQLQGLGSAFSGKLDCPTSNIARRNSLHRSVTVPLQSKSSLEKGNATPASVAFPNATDNYYTPQSKLPSDTHHIYHTTVGGNEILLKALQNLFQKKSTDAILVDCFQIHNEMNSADNLTCNVPINLQRSISAPLLGTGLPNGSSKISYHRDRANDYSLLSENSEFNLGKCAASSPPSFSRNYGGHITLRKETFRHSFGMDSSGAFSFGGRELSITTPSTENLRGRDSLDPFVRTNEPSNVYGKSALRKKKAKLRRLSKALPCKNRLFDSSDSSMNISNEYSQFPADLRSRRKSVAFCSGSFDEYKMISTESCSNSVEKNNFASRQIPIDHVKKIVSYNSIIGGNFRGHFDNGFPVIITAEITESRVESFRLSKALDLSIRIYCPPDQNSKWVDLGRNWFWTPCSPVGLLFGSHLLNDIKVQFYFIPNLPPNWLDSFQAQDDLEFDSSLMLDDSVMMSVIDNSDSTGTSNFLLPSTIIDRIVTFLSVEDLFESSLTINKVWAISSQKQILSYFQLHLTSLNCCDSWKHFQAFTKKFNRGKFLSDGGFKKVYCIQSDQRLEALSIMDLKELLDQSLEAVATVELVISRLCSSLISLNICPNMIKVYSVFRSDYDLSNWAGWRVESIEDLNRSRKVDHREIQKRQFKKTSLFQYCHMEYCKHGDLEEFMRRETTVPTEKIRSFLFQMCFALFCGRETLSLRHFDVKLLNFFVTNQVDDRHINGNLYIGFGKNIYEIVCNTSASVVKLADFGTSVIGSDSMGIPVSLPQVHFPLNIYIYIYI
jgi:hypothetical protein